MKVIVITGSTRGIGLGLAKAFLERDCSVVFSGRRQESVDEAMEKLAADHPAGILFGISCDVTQYEQVQALWDQTNDRFGKVDIWINNAGLGHPQTDFWDHPPERISTIINTNLTGTMYGTQVALRGMLGQGFGFVYNMEGLGSGGGRKVQGLSLYASTKAGLSYFDEALIAETKDTPVKIGVLRPGMVLTDMLVGQRSRTPEEWEQAKRIFNILADRVETVAPWMADRILANNRHGELISWLTPSKAMARFLLAPFHKRNITGE